MANELTYEDYKRRISIRDVLVDAGYSFNRKDGLRYPTYSRKDADGNNIKGDKFIITANGLCCFRPPEHRNYNIISFIKSFPELFKDYTPGMNHDYLVNQVCCRLLNEPIVHARKEDLPPPSNTVEHKEFNLNGYYLLYWQKNDAETQRSFSPYFTNRGISLDTQRAFSQYFFIASGLQSKNNIRNLSFPMRIPRSEKVVGLEVRGIPGKNGESFKGMALNTNATQGMWIASPLIDITKANELKRAREVYWFESAYDAMAFYQLHPSDKTELDRSIFISTGGSPSRQQFKGMLDLTDKARHHLCFDNDRAGRMFAINFAIARSGKEYSTHIATVGDMDAGIAKEGQLVVNGNSDKGERFTLNIEPFDYGRICSVINVSKPDMKDYLESLKDRNDFKSGNLSLLPADSYSSRIYREMAYLGKNTEEYKKMERLFTGALFRDIQAFRNPGGATIYEPCNPRFKDYNDQLLQRPMQDKDLTDKRQMSSEDIVESCLDGTDGVYLEFYSAHEEEDDTLYDEQERKGIYRR